MPQGSCNILFVCTGNSARSILAEALMLLPLPLDTRRDRGLLAALAEIAQR